MKIVIAGAGDVGLHLAKLLANENHAITLIDENQEVLDSSNRQIDVFGVRGDSSSLEVLRQADIENTALFLAVTTSEKNNLMSAILAKKLGAKQTIARVDNEEYLLDSQKALFNELGIDALISPRHLASIEIKRLLKENAVTDLFNFEDGKISVVGITLDENSILLDLTLQQIDEEHIKHRFRCIAILRNGETIIPRGTTRVRRNDHIYFLARQEKVKDIANMIGKAQRPIKNIMILGGKDLGFITTKLLQNDYNITVVENCKDTCRGLVEDIHNALIIHADPSNIQILKEEGIEKMDAVIALTPNTEANIIACLVAENLGNLKTIALVDNTEYIHISQNIGVDTLINKKLIAANNIFRFVRQGNVKAIASLHGVDAEVIEFVIESNNEITKKPIRDLEFPQQALIGGVVRGEESLVPTGDFQLKKDDKVIVFAKNEAIYEVENFFK